MKKSVSSILIIALVSFASCGFAQPINWRSMQTSDKHILNVNAGWDYSTTFGIGYGYKLNSKIPAVVGGEFSVPSGSTVFDDLKTKLGAQAEVFRHNHFSATLRVQGIFRRYESDFVRLANFGSEFAAVAGYYKARWYAAVEFGFDKSIITHIKHSSLMEEYYSDAKSGWYIPTGGNFFYGAQVGYSLKEYDLYVKAGKTITQDLKTTSAIPLYAGIGVNKRF